MINELSDTTLVAVGYSRTRAAVVSNHVEGFALVYSGSSHGLDFLFFTGAKPQTHHSLRP